MLDPKGTTTEEFLLDLMRQLDALAPAPTATLKKKLLVLSTPRSGSTMFCDVLNRVGVFGECWEWFNFRYMAAYGQLKGQSNVDFNEYLNFIISRTTGETGVLAVNMHVEQYVQLKEKGLDAFQLGFDHVIYLYRKDKIAQALSLARARATDAWVAATEARDVRFGVDEITSALQHLIKSEQIFRQHIQPRVAACYAYERFRDLTRPDAFIEVLRAMGQGDCIPETWGTGLQSQASGSGDLKNAYLNYLSGDGDWF